MKFSWVPLLALVSSCAAYHILVVFPTPSRSHGFLGDGIVRALLDAGHEVTYITPFPKKNQPKNLHQIETTFMEDMMQVAAMTNVLKEKMTIDISQFLEMGHSLAVSLVGSDAVQDLLKDKSQNFDAVITEWFMTDFYSGFAQVFQCPWILFSPAGMEPSMQYLIDEVQSPATSPSLFTGFTVPLSLKERIISSAVTFGGIIYTIFIDWPRATPDYIKYYTPGAEARGVTLQEYPAACHNISLLLVNSHVSLGQATRLPPNAVEIGGHHIDPDTKPLPKDLQDLLDNSPEGLIYFSMGSNLKSADMSEKMRQDLLRTFGALKLKVLWKFEDEMSDAPKNVHIRSWVPQPSLLAHKNLKIFITHGGLLSTTEAIYYGVPLIGIPIFGDQPVNMQRAERKGYALKVEFFSPELGKELGEAIEKMLEDPSYTQTAKRLSQLYHDRPIPPRRAVAYWTEHVVRTGGAPHLRTAASAVPAYQRYLLDVLALLVAALVLVFFLLRASIRYIASLILPSSTRRSKKNN